MQPCLSQWSIAVVVLCGSLLPGPVVPHADAASGGEVIFQQRCASCHTIGGGNLVGPDLKGVTTRRERAWLIRWIREPDKMLAEGEPQATKIFNEFNKVPMPNMGLTESEAAAVVAHLDSTSGVAATPPVAGPLVPPTREDVQLGQALFQGTARFASGGPSCISCHHVKNDAVIGGGILARELTTVFSRMGGNGVRAILGGPPFPVMQAAYQDMPFTEDEVRALVGFLQQADAEHALQRPKDYGWGLFYAGVGGVTALLGGYALRGRRRKKQSVNQAIYDRQIKSE